MTDTKLIYSLQDLKGEVKWLERGKMLVLYLYAHPVSEVVITLWSMIIVMLESVEVNGLLLSEETLYMRYSLLHWAEEGC